MKTYHTIGLFLFFLFQPVAGLPGASPSGSFFEACDAFLKKYVDDGLVHYARIKKNREDLTRVLRLSEQMTFAPDASADMKLAFWINAYNLHVIETVVDHYPLESPKEVFGFFSRRKHRVAGRQLTLDEIEHEIIRKQFKDPRIHFALVCAAISCPPIIPEAYLPDRLQEQLDSRTEAVINDPKFVRVESPGTVWVSALFKWYQSDFVAEGGHLLDFINRYRRSKIAATSSIRFMSYDWSLNDTGELEEDDQAFESLQQYTPSTLLPPGHYELKWFNNLYTQTAFFDEAGSRRPLNARTTYFTGILYTLFGWSETVNVGLDLYFKSVRTDRKDSSPFSILRFETGPNARTALATVAPKIKIVPFAAIPNLSMQTLLVIPVAADLQGLQGGGLFLEYDDVQWWTQLFLDYRLNPTYYLYLESGLFVRFDRRDPALLTPVKVILNAFLSSKTTTYFQAELAPTWDGLNWSTYYSQIGMGLKYLFLPNFEIEILYTAFPIGKSGGAGQTYNLGLRVVL